MQREPQRPPFRHVPAWCALAVVVFSAVILIGWYFHLPKLRAPFNVGHPITPAGAGLFLLLGAALLMLARWESSPPARRLAVLALSIVLVHSSLTIAEYITGRAFGIDALFMRSRVLEWWASPAPPGRYALNAALAFAGLAAALLLRNARLYRIWVRELLALLVGALALLGLVGYAYGVHALSGLGQRVWMARNGSVMFGALAIGAFFLDCERGIARLVTSGDSGGIMARRMAVATVASLFVLGGIAIWAVKSTVIAIEIATACLVVASIVVMCVLILATASALHRLEKARQADNIALQESAHQLQLATDAAELGVWTWNPADNEVFCSEQAKKIFGIEKDGALFAYPFLLSRVHPEDRERVRLNGMKEASTEYMNEYRIVRHDGTTGWVALRGRRFGNTVDSSMIGVISDITDRKLSEDALVRNEKLASVGRMAASIAHEINNPLAAVMNLLYLCRSDASLSPNSQRLLLDAEAELGRVAHITRQTLGFYREHASPAYVVMADLVKQTCDFYRYRAEQSRITIDVRLRSSVSTVYANAGEIRQVISNLLVNGLDSMSSGGTLHLRLAQIGSTVRITVADVGCGIDTKYNNRIFEPFFTTKETTGTGLGLWICRQIIERHGGKIRMRSKRQKGTVFVVSLPASAAPRAAAAIAP